MKMARKVSIIVVAVCCAAMLAILTLNTGYTQAANGEGKVREKEIRISRDGDRVLVKDAFAYIGLINAYKANVRTARRALRPGEFAQQTITLFNRNLAYVAVTFEGRARVVFTQSYKLDEKEELKLIDAAKKLRNSRIFSVGDGQEADAWLKKIDDPVTKLVGPDVVGVAVVNVHKGAATELGVLLNPTIFDTHDFDDPMPMMFGGSGLGHPTEDYLAMDGADMIDQVSKDVNEFPGFTNWVWWLWEKVGGDNPYKELVADANGDDGDGGNGDDGDGGNGDDGDGGNGDDGDGG